MRRSGRPLWRLFDNELIVVGVVVHDDDRPSAPDLLVPARRAGRAVVEAAVLVVHVHTATIRTDREGGGPGETDELDRSHALRLLARHDASDGHSGHAGGGDGAKCRGDQRWDDEERRMAQPVV